MKTSFEGKGVWAGNWTFCLSTLGGALGGSVGLLFGINTAVQDRLALYEVFASAISCGTGGATIGLASGAVLGLFLGSSAARSFHLVFCVALAWLLCVLVPLGVMGFDRKLSPNLLPWFQRYHPYIGLVAIIVGSGIGLRLASGCTGFSQRARRRAGIGFVIGVAATLIVAAGIVGIPAAFRARADEKTALAMLAMCVGMSGAILGALLGGDRDQLRGFAVLPISEHSVSNLSPRAQR